MRKKQTLVIVISGIIIFSFIGLYYRHKDLEPSLKIGGSVLVDFGPQTVKGQDFTAESEILLPNRTNHPIKILEVKKSCACYTVELMPKEDVPPEGSLSVRFIHQDVTNRKGGSFYDRIILKISDGKQTGDVFLNYKGFVIKSSYTVPAMVELRNARRNADTDPEVVYVFLSRISAVDKKFKLLVPYEIRTIKTPDNIEAKLLDLSDRSELEQIAPQTIFAGIEQRDKRDLSGTERELKRFVSDNATEISRTGLWQVFVLAVRAANVVQPVNDNIILETNLANIKIPVKVQMISDLLVYPKVIALFGNGKSSQSCITVRNSTGGILNILTVEANNPSLDLKVKTVSNSEAKLLIDLKEYDISNKDVLAKIILKTNIGSIEIPYKFILNE